MKTGIHLVSYDVPGGAPAIAPVLAETAALAEDGGIATLSLMDHYLQIGGMGLGEIDAPMLEGYTTLGYLAAHTSTVRLQLLVTGTTYRHPGLLAKIVSTLDVLSGGRAALGLGAAWYEREHHALGVPFPPLAERFERLEETLQIVRRMWSDDSSRYEGRHYRLAETVNSPQPLRTPRPPVMIGGGGEKKTLRLVAKYADAWNLPVRPGDGVETFRTKLAVLHDHCKREDRDPATISTSVMYVGGPPSDSASTGTFLREMEAYAAMGVQEVHLMPFGPDPRPVVSRLGEQIVPLLAPL
ncbi:LLM class F420-dependent oxidoreductase [Kitasatospora sp. NPDC085879]|uniref:LLM class F420-dependent oxidoreductase n=1 Tax=Kitasatospora sp. NPDC085879 TaxID=3154769 RepID=UPI0034231DF2